MAQNIDFKVINSHIDTNINSSSTNTSASFSTLSTSIDAKPSSALTVINGGGTGIDEEQLNKLLQTKQDTLVSGSNIKTINNYSILGAGNLKVVSPEEPELLDQTYRDETLNINNRINTLNNSLSLVATSGEYEDLLNKPKIPAKTSDLDNDLNFIDKNIADLTNYSKTSDFKQVAFTGNYSDLINTPNIPTRTSQLTNDSNYTTLTDLSKVTELIPNTATADNQLADKNFVNSSISTATAEFRGTVEDLESLNSITANINDYAFYKHVDANGNTLFDRYKFTDKWEYEYTLNNSSFTAEQWTTINSGITENSIPTKVSELVNDSGFTSNQGTITEIKVNGVSKGTGGSVNLTNMVTFASSQTATVAGITKITYRYNQPAGDQDTNSSNGSAYFPEGIIMGGTAFSAGLVTRGITGVTTPDATTGACNKENLYINFDGNFNDYSYKSNRQVILQAAIPGTHYGSNLY